MKNVIELNRPSPLVMRGSVLDYRYDDLISRTVVIRQSAMDAYEGVWTPEPGSMEHLLNKLKEKRRRKNLLRARPSKATKYHWQGNTMCMHSRSSDALAGDAFDGIEKFDRCQSCDYHFVNG